MHIFLPYLLFTAGCGHSLIQQEWYSYPHLSHLILFFVFILFSVVYSVYNFILKLHTQKMAYVCGFEDFVCSVCSVCNTFSLYKGDIFFIFIFDTYITYINMYRKNCTHRTHRTQGF